VHGWFWNNNLKASCDVCFVNTSDQNDNKDLQVSSLCINTHTHTRKHMYIYIYMYTHTHTHTHIVSTYMYTCKTIYDKFSTSRTDSDALLVLILIVLI
jgi:hypothetical protein